MITNINDVYNFLYEWAHFVINIRFGCNLPIIIGSQNVASTDREYIVIHQPPVSIRKIGDGQNKKNEKLDLGGGIIVRHTTYTNTFEATISFEAIQNLDCLSLLDESIIEDSIFDMWKKEKITFVQMESMSNSNELSGTIIEKREIQDLHIMFTSQKEYNDYFIENIEYTGIVT